jgi:hypothetical protein
LLDNSGQVLQLGLQFNYLSFNVFDFGNNSGVCFDTLFGLPFLEQLQTTGMCGDLFL